MNTTAKALIFAVVSVASAASIGIGLADRSAHPKTEVIRLERVVIEGHRVHADAQVARRVEHLPRVVVDGHRTRQTEALQVAEVKASVKAI